MSNFISISNTDLHGVTGGTEPPVPPKPPTAPRTPTPTPPDDTGQYCKDGMKQHIGIGGDADVQTPLGFKINGSFRYDQTDCK